MRMRGWRMVMYVNRDRGGMLLVGRHGKMVGSRDVDACDVCLGLFPPVTVNGNAIENPDHSLCPSYCKCGIALRFGEFVFHLVVCLYPLLVQFSQLGANPVKICVAARHQSLAKRGMIVSARSVKLHP